MQWQPYNNVLVLSLNGNNNNKWIPYKIPLYNKYKKNIQNTNKYEEILVTGQTDITYFDFNILYINIIHIIIHSPFYIYITSATSRCGPFTAL